MNKKHLLLMLMILAVAAFCRLYRIDEYMTFLGDEGRDAIVVRRLLLYADPILVGPGTSIGNMYLGPLYYYFIAPFLWLFNYSPVGPSVLIALVGVATTALVWRVSREWFGVLAAAVASFLYAISPTVIIYSRSSWNPNIMPFFSLLCIYAIWQIWQKLEFKWLLVLGISFAFVLQSHYLGLLLLPTIGFFWLLTFLKARKAKSLKPLILTSFFSLLIFGFLMSPLVIFDARHGWRNFESLKKFFGERQTTVSARPWASLPKIIPIWQKVALRLVAAKNEIVGGAVTVLLFAPLLLFIKRKNYKQWDSHKDAFLLLGLWIGVSLIGLGLYKQEIYDHYYGFFFAAPFLVLGGLSQVASSMSRVRGTSLVIVGVLILAVANILDNPLKYAPNRQMQRTIEVADAIIEKSGGEMFNLGVIAERNYDDAYEYFLRVRDAKMVDIDPQNASATIAKSLFVVCEMPRDKCDPTHNPKAEVANFGWSKIEEEWHVAGTILFKLGHAR